MLLLLDKFSEGLDQNYKLVMFYQKWFLRSSSSIYVVQLDISN